MSEWVHGLICKTLTITAGCKYLSWLWVVYVSPTLGLHTQYPMHSVAKGVWCRVKNKGHCGCSSVLHPTHITFRIFHTAFQFFFFLSFLVLIGQSIWLCIILFCLSLSVSLSSLCCSRVKECCLILLTSVCLQSFQPRVWTSGRCSNAFCSVTTVRTSRATTSLWIKPATVEAH